MRTRSWMGAWCAAVVLGPVLLAPSSQAEQRAKLGVPAHVPGPVWLHEPPASHPILENTGGWQAEPLLVSGVDAYTSGEYLFQDFVYDAYGANTTDVPLVPPDTAPSSVSALASAPTGDVSQPTDVERFGNNAGDLLELRARPVEGGVAYRITLNTLLEPDASIVAIGIDTDRTAATGTNDWGSGIGSLGSLGLEHLVVTWGTGAVLDGRPIPVTVDVERNQIEVVVPLDPGDASWRHYAVTGVHGTEVGTFAPVGLTPSVDAPSGAHGTDAPPVLNVGFRRAEQEPMGADVTELGPRGVYSFGAWRDHAQAQALAARDIAAFHADIDFGTLRRGVEASNVPTTGFMNRLVVSRLDLGEGVASSGPTDDTLVGPIQPYGLYLPEDHDPTAAAPFTLLLHAAACNYNQYGSQTPQLLAQLDEARGSIVATPMARGPMLGYRGIGEVDTFEVWADVAHRYPLDFDRVALSGISMGGIGSFRLASLYPDLFSRVFPIAGQGSAVIDLAENLRNVPLLMWNGVPDELVRIDQVLPYQQRLEELGYRHRLDLFPLIDHLVRPLGTGTDFSRGAAFLGTAPLDRNPRRVTYRVLPAMADPDLRLNYAGAYWVSGITVADGVEHGTVDVVDHAAPAGEPVAETYTHPGGDPDPHVARGVKWLPRPGVLRNHLGATLTGVRAVALDLHRSRLDSNRTVTATVDTDQRVELTLRGLRPGMAVTTNGGALRRVGTTGTFILTLPPGQHEITFRRG